MMDHTPETPVVMRAIVRQIDATDEQLSDVAVFQPLLDQRLRVDQVIDLGTDVPYQECPDAQRHKADMASTSGTRRPVRWM